MSIYISKNAINNIPLVEENIINSNTKELQNQLLNNDSYLNGLATGNYTAYKKLRLKSKGNYIIRIKMALSAIDEIHDDYTILNKLNLDSDEFDDNLKKAVEDFQEWLTLEKTGVIDSTTILAIDSKLTYNDIFDYEKKKYVGKVNEKSKITIETTINDNGGSTFSVIIEGGEPVIITTKEKLNIDLIRKKNNPIIDGIVYGIADEKFQNELNKLPAVAAKNKEREIKNLPPLKSIGLNVKDYNIKLDNISLPFSAIESELEKTPPFDENGAKLYKIQPGDKISQIVIDNYYGDDEFVIMDPYTDTPIFTLPKRKLFPKEKRGDDARFQFYHNLLYYYNSEQKGSNPVKEWGLKTNNYDRYTIDHLDTLNIFDNKYVAGIPDTGLPNYYRFLKKMEALNLNSKMKFDTLGNVTSFETVEGKNIRIPSRQFADSMYYFLNFRHDEMLVPVNDPNEESGTVMDYIKEEALDILDTITDAIEDVADEVKTDATELYHETVDFFVSAYNFVIESLTKYWPRGVGGKFDIGGSITWGIPVKTKLDLERGIYRKMSKEDELTLIYTTKATVGIGVEHAEGFSYGIGKYSGQGTSNKFFEAALGVEAQSEFSIIQTTEYEFPIRQNETALLTMAINVFAGQITQSVVGIFDSLYQLNLNPKQYISKIDAKYNLKVEAEVNALVGAKLKEGIQIPTSNMESPARQDETKSYGSIDNIFSKIPAFGIHGEGTINLGASYSYKVKYDKMPFTFANKGRVFKEIEVESKYFVDAKLDLDMLNNLFVGLVPNSGSQGNTFIGTLFDKLSFDKKGVMFGTNYKYIRNSTPDSLQSTDFDFTNIQTNEGSFTLKYLSPDNRLSKEVSLYFGAYSGNAGLLCEPGTEVKFLLHMPTFLQIWHTGSTFVYTAIVISRLFKGIQLNKKVGLFSFKGEERKKKKKKKKNNDNAICDQLLNSFNSGKFLGDGGGKEMNKITEFVKKILKYTDASVALGAKMKIDFDSIDYVFDYYRAKLYLKYSIYEDDIPEQLKVTEKLETRKTEIHKILTANNIKGISYYKELYKDGNVLNTSTLGLGAYVKTLTPNSGKSYLNVAIKIFQSVFSTNTYMNNIVSDEDSDYGTSEFINAFSFVTDLGELEGKLESKVNFGYETDIKGGLLGAVVGGSLNGFVELNFQPVLYENGKLTDLEINDPMKVVYNKIEKILGKGNDNKRAGAKTIFQVLKK